MMQVILSNSKHPEYGQATIPLPLAQDQYEDCVELLEKLEIGSATKQDCKVLEISSAFPVLKRTEMLTVNLDELDYLAKRLASFDVGEAAQFQAMAHKLELFELKDLINLTFCCQQATVITDFTNLEAIGRDHYMNLYGGCASTQELEDLDGAETARLLIDSGAGEVTPYGVVYDNGMKLEQYYDGQHFPAYLYEPCMLMIGLTFRLEPEDTKNITWLYLPAAKGQLERAMVRSGITDPADMRFRFSESMFPDEVDAALDFRYENIYELNDLALAVSKLSVEAQKKLGAVVEMAEPEYASQICRLAENLDQFEFAPGAHTPAEYGRFMIQESGHFEYDENLEGFYDYEKFGLQRMEQESGMFTDRGYVSYHGTMSLEELMMEDPTESFREGQGLQMGGMK
ncbi:antirestriction protein ArdA [Dysosmobacter sp.]|uniref:antirestriction protein ArdA n=1 Tax=Dysosmobacter sp. TaxID=2591382 RepID=UPI002673437F|nr:antirestriction protein ArdA [Dysosmobacter sp.]MCI7215936.1 antirestriction protein ArdA [Dysosmobacter sp.]MCI7282272.1 antirestriction protein ArdA [Dysosmobacter sp.]MDY3654239.1 antirestriction protein ArdA [Dysosmobacter sp.]